MLIALVASWFIAAAPASPSLNTLPPVRILVSRGNFEIVRAIRLSGATGGDGALQANDILAVGNRVVLREKGLISLQVPSGVVQFMGPGEASMVAPAHYFWQGERAVISALGNPVQISVEGGTVSVGAGSVRLRRTERGIIIEALDAGQAAVMGSTGIMTLKPGAGILLPDAGPLAKSVVLPHAPALLLPAPHNRLRAFRFKWRAVPDAASYRLELSRDPMFQEIIYAQESTAPVISDRARSLPVGLLFWRVATRSAAGFEGIPSEPRAFRVAP